MNKQTNYTYLTNILHVFLILLCINITESKAQDPHFSQFYASPLTLNPALTGMVPGDFRVAANFRTQWAAVATPFLTSSAAFDIKILPSLIGTEDILGLGIMAMDDRSNNGALKATYLSLSLAYNKQLDRAGNFRLGAGFQTTLTNKTIDYSKLTFSQQFTPYGYDINLPNGEPRPGFNLYYTDLQAGILLSGKNDDNSNMWYVGSSLYHIGRPNESVTGQDNRLQQRITVHGMYNMKVGDVDRMYLSGLYMKSSIMTEYTFGVVYSFNIDGEQDEESVGRSFQAGSWYRFKDAVIPYIGLQLNNVKFGLTYDVNASKLSTASNFRGGFELTMVYNFIESENMRLRRKTLCPAHGSYLKWFGY